MLAAAQAALVGGEEPAQTLLQHLLRTESALLAGRPQAATVAFDQAVRSARTWQPMPWLLDEMRRVEVDLLSLVPDAPAAGQPADAPPTGPVSLTAHSTAARRTLLSGDAPGALAQAQAASSSAAGAASLPVLDQRALVELALVEAVASDQLRREHDALYASRRAIALAEPTGLAAPFLLAGFARLPRLLVRARETSAAPPEMLGSLLRRLGEHRQPANEPAPLLQSLTQRELTLLTLLPSVRTNPELADDLFVSVNTVKSHLKSLYRKLDVNNRRQAVRRARDLGLIP
jgi:LuxR family maltose regulon positive regulatory protein